MNTKKHNGVISLYKFIFALMILAHHFYLINDPAGPEHSVFKCGAIAVDFFFIVSGCLLAEKVNSEKRRNDLRPLHIATKDFIFKKIKAFMPYLLFSFIIVFVICLIVQDRSLTETINGFITLTFVKMGGFPGKAFGVGTWYLSAMILAMLIVYPLQKKLGKNFSYIIAPLIAIFLGGYLMQTVDSLRQAGHWTGFAFVGMIKAFFEISLGCTVFEIKEWLKKINFTSAGRWLVSLIQILCFLGVIIPNLFLGNVRPLDWLFIILLVISVSLAFSGQCYNYDLYCNRFFYYLEKLSLPLFLNNGIIIKILNSFDVFDPISWKARVIIVFFGTILLSIIEMPFIDLCKKWFSALGKKLRHVLIADSDN